MGSGWAACSKRHSSYGPALLQHLQVCCAAGTQPSCPLQHPQLLTFQVAATPRRASQVLCQRSHPAWCNPALLPIVRCESAVLQAAHRPVPACHCAVGRPALHHGCKCGGAGGEELQGKQHKRAGQGGLLGACSAPCKGTAGGRRPQWQPVAPSSPLPSLPAQHGRTPAPAAPPSGCRLPRSGWRGGRPRRARLGRGEDSRRS